MSTVASAILWSAVISAVSAGAQTAVSAEASHTAAHAQKVSQERAEAQQEKANKEAEQQRLEGIAANQSATNYGNVWGASESKKYADAAQKLSAGTGSFDTDDDETNPFYSRGLI